MNSGPLADRLFSLTPDAASVNRDEFLFEHMFDMDQKQC